MSFVLKTRNCVLKTKDFVLKMMNFAGALSAIRNLELVVQMLPPGSLDEMALGRSLAPCADALVRGVLDVSASTP